ncbi:hypothetical protein E2562_031555 [Oryza meyeriana var. granulata]|uniref:Uncharacterized protein n=1 Tax=Oryza meyeriana var. granulata TaxID=110450 RepID=A0A6G1CV73_9ORYZ|nr:hypothetical protein E2562_031555 [Oryza meyeriana var. granulata]
MEISETNTHIWLPLVSHPPFALPAPDLHRVKGRQHPRPPPPVPASGSFRSDVKGQQSNKVQVI